MERLIESIDRWGLEEPLLLTGDQFILSGHRRYYACVQLGWDKIPVRTKHNILRSERNGDYRRLLTEFNSQRVKSAGMMLKEAMMRMADKNPEALLWDHDRASVAVDLEFQDVRGSKFIRDISANKKEFLDATVKVVDSLRDFWPVSVRQVHYKLLNDPPLISTPKRSKFDREHYRYRNDKTSYNAVIELLKQARCLGHVNMASIDDATRPRFPHTGFRDAAQFIQQQMDGFLVGYHRHRQLDQPRHIECLGEKNTLLQILKPVCESYYVPLSLGRGYGSIPIWRDMAHRFQQSDKNAMTLIIASDYDPEGLDLADDGVRTLRDLWGVPVDYFRIAVTREQIDELDLVNDFNPAKITSSRLESFIVTTRGEKTWELEALPPEYIQDQLRAAIEANMDMDIYEQTVEQEQRDAEEIADFRRQLVEDFDF